MTNKVGFFQERANNFLEQIEILKAKFNAFSFYRIAVFVVFLICAIWSIKTDNLTVLLLLIVAFIFAFGLLVNRHNRIGRSKKLSQKLFELNIEEVNRLNFKFDGISDGSEFVDEKHTYTSDLDIFGRNSIFQLINRACTPRGMHLLKSWFETASSNEEIGIRHKVVNELNPLVDWRQKIQAHGKNSKNKKENEQAFFSWLGGDDFIGKNILYKVIPYLVIVFSLFLLGGVLVEKLSGYFLLFPFIISGFFLYKIFDYSRNTYDMTISGVKILESVENMVLLIENQNFSHKHLVQLKNQFLTKDLVASQKIKDLRKILELLNLRGNQMYHILNFFFLLDFIILAKAEKWRANYKDEIPGWFDAIAEFEALNSIAAFSFANENYIFPQIEDKPFLFESKNLGHPLIPPDKRVNNDFNLNGKGNTCIITGSNMAGKSTFLRTVGVNAVLALSGAPVCADSFQISNFQVFTSMRTKDNLEENISSFYAELLRLKMLLEQIDEETPVLFLLDEILKGTNSADRHIGAESLILQLNKMNAFGLVSTHDLELGNLEKSNSQITNYNFSSSISGKEIVFDYKLQDGICKSTNASQLMAKIGIQIKS